MYTPMPDWRFMHSIDESVVVRKVRRFEEINGGTATNVSEVMNGQCPFLLQ